MIEGEGDDEFRHRCLVRHVIKVRLKDRNAAHQWLNGYRDGIGKLHKGWVELHPESRLVEDVKQQWSLGNRGEKGEWK